jgi:hypothetical protein
MRALVKKLSYCLALFALVRGSWTSSNEEVLDVDAEFEKRATGNTTLKAPIIATPSEDWYVPFRSLTQSPRTDKTSGKE